MCSLNCLRNSQSALLNAWARSRVAIITPNTRPSTMSGAATNENNPAAARR
jgi:hypothetical protein